MSISLKFLLERKEIDGIVILLILIAMLAVLFNYIEPTITGFSHKPSHDPGGGGSGGGGGGGGTAQPGTAETGTGVGVQKIVGIYPQFPLEEQVIKNGEYIFSTKVTFGGSPTSTARVKLNSTLFEVVSADYKGGVLGIYDAKITIQNKSKGKYRIVYKAEDKETEEFGMFITLDPELRIENELKNNYSKGEKIIFKGLIKDFKDEPQPNATVRINAYNKGILFEEILSTDVLGRFSYEYLISHADPKGLWNITIEAYDKYGNYGSKAFGIEVKQSGIEHYIVSFMSPLTDSEFKRSEVIPITIQLKEANELVENAKVSFYSPVNEKIELKEIDKGTYSTNYIVGSDDPLGNIFLRIDAYKEIKEGIVKVGGDSLPVKIAPTEISFGHISPSRDIVYINSKLKIKIKLSYQDGSAVEGADVKAELLNGKVVFLVEGERGVYSGEYLLTEEDEGALNIKIAAEDIDENIGTTELTLFVRKRGIIGNLSAVFYENVIRRFWWAFLTIAIATVLLYRRDLEMKYFDYMLSRTRSEQKSVSDMQKDTEKKYYKDGSINRAEFKKLMQNYEERDSGLNEKEKKFMEKIKEFNKAE